MCAFFLVAYLTTSDRERVEQILDEMLVLAEQGGPGAAGRVREHLSPELESDLPIENMIDRLVAQKAITEITLGSYETVWIGDRIVVPILRVDIRTNSRTYTGFCTLTFEKHGDRWLLAKVSRVKFGG